MGQFFDELKRRNVLRVAIAYLATSWLVIQVVETFFPIFGQSDALIRLVAILLVIGFPLILIFSWLYELTPEGLKLERDVDRSRSAVHHTGKKLDRAIIVVLTLALGYFAFDKFVLDPARDAEREETVAKQARSEALVESYGDKSIAVLPFENMSQDNENQPFTIGIHDDILTQISKISALKVISRSSVQSLDMTQRIQEIGRSLGVANVLEGGVQRSGDRIRINVKLIDTASARHVWAETYDRQLTASNIFQIQSEIANSIAGHLRTQLTDRETESLGSDSTASLISYDEYILGRQAWEKRTTESVTEAILHFESAIEADPEFAPAYVGLADSYMVQIVNSGSSDANTIAQAESAILFALSLNEQSSSAHASLASLKQIQYDYIAAESSYLRAIQLNPNNANAYEWYADMLAFIGRNDEALIQLEKARALNPLSAAVNINIAYVLGQSGRVQEALAQHKKIIEIAPTMASNYRLAAFLYWNTLGQLDEAVVSLRKGISLDPGNASAAVFLGLIYLDLGDSDRAAFWINRGYAIGPEGMWARHGKAWLHWNRHEYDLATEFAVKALDQDPGLGWGATLAYLRNRDIVAGSFAAARERYERYYPDLLNEQEPSIDSTNYRPAVDLAWLLSFTGEQQRASQLLQQCLEFLKGRSRLGDEGYRVSDVVIYALQGEKKLAISALRDAIDEGWRNQWWIVASHDPSLQSIRGEPEFRDMMGELGAEMALQLDRIRHMEKNGELALIPPLN
jgi:TolB-like protein/Tfp pilus assembly protein PilF